MGRSCRPFGEQIRFACAAWCCCQGARFAVATCAMPFSTCLKRDANGRGFAQGLRDPPHPAATAIALHSGGVNALPCGAPGRT